MFDYDQIKEENVIMNLTFQIFVSYHLNILYATDTIAAGFTIIAPY